MRALIIPCALIATVLLIYSNALTGTFLYDDEFLIQKNIIVQNFKLLPQAFVTSTTEGSGGQDSFYRPLQTVAYSLIYQAFGLNPFWFHLFNALIHGLNALLVYRLIGFLFSDPRLSLLTALLWAVHPIHTEAIAYISATADPLHFFFGLLFILTSFKKGGKWKLLSLLFFLAALLTKEASVTFPALLFAAHLSRRLFKGKAPWGSVQAALRVALPSLLIAIVYTLLRKTVLDFEDSFVFYTTDNFYTTSLLNRTFTALAGLTKYAELLVWPEHLQIDRTFPVFPSLFHARVMIGLLLAMASLSPLFLLGKASPILIFLPLWFWGYHFLHTGIPLPLNSIFLEHWMYVPSLSLIAGFVYFLSSVLKTPRFTQVAVAVCMAIALALGVRTYRQNSVWRDPISLYTHILKGSPQVARVHNNLAMAYSDKKQFELAKKHYLKSIEIDDSYPQVRHNLGLLYLTQNQIDQGIYQLKKALEINPRFFHSHFYLAKAYEFKGDMRRAKEHMEKFRELAPKFKPPELEP